MSKVEIIWGKDSDKHFTHFKKLFHLPINYVDIDTWNYFAQDLVNREQGLVGDYKYEKLLVTKSGNISKKQYFSTHKYLIEQKNSFVSLFIWDERGYTRIALRNGVDSRPEMTGRQAFWKLVDELKADGVTLFDYTIDREQGERLHAMDSLEGNRLIKVVAESEINATLHNVHHLDLRSAYAAGVAYKYPSLAPTLNRLFNEREETPVYKHVLNLAIGMFESSYLDYKFKHLALDAHRFTRTMMEAMTKQIRANGGTVLLYNTDGIWYHGAKLNIVEGTTLGSWRHDHINTTFRMKSAGAYEFIENGKYNVVLRGKTNLDKIKPREEWEWGDIYVKPAGVYELLELRQDIKTEIKLVTVMKEM